MTEKQVKLHPAEAAFLKSEALFRGFCGGIGSGKSWTLCYDVLKRSRPRRLYAILAPTFSMLSDSIFRTFTQLAEDLCILDPAEVKHSAPQSAKLRTGAEILFRSADDPSRLYGPNPVSDDSIDPSGTPA